MMRVKDNEQGLVSIAVTSILILVITLTVMAFAQMVRSEQRQAFDSQLSNQAFYAAESGVNVARSYIEQTFIDKGAAVPDKRTCDYSNPSYADLADDATIDAAAGTSVSCLLITSNLKSLTYDSLGDANSSVVFPVETTTRMQSIDFSWKPKTDSGTPATGCTTPTSTLPTPDQWGACGYGMLRIDLVPASSGLDQISLMQNTYTAFVYPANGGSGASNFNHASNSNLLNGRANQGAKPTASCTNGSASVAAACTLRINLNSMSDTKYYARVMSLYRGTPQLTVTANTTTAKDTLIGAQVMIDATGKANDVLRRVQVRVPLVGSGSYPDYAILSTDSLCKRFDAFPGRDIQMTCGED